MTTHIQRRAFNIFAMFDGLEEYLNTGDPVLREWFLVKSNYMPIFLCSAYLFTIKVLLPAYMRDRKPFELRKTMIVYNMFLVLSYFISISIVIFLMSKTDSSVLCRETVVTKANYTYTMATCGWVIYLLKYVEFLDTIFFCLRKKENLITNLHVIHHTALPLCGWIVFRTERSGFQAYPIIINSIVHIAMYSYYGLAAMGPSVRKYLWWKRYLTIAQMIQFVVIIIFVTVLMPLSGCSTAKTSYLINLTAATLFLILFYNFYQTSFKSTKAVQEKSNGDVKKPTTNGNYIEEKVKCN